MKKEFKKLQIHIFYGRYRSNLRVNLLQLYPKWILLLNLSKFDEIIKMKPGIIRYFNGYIKQQSALKKRFILQTEHYQQNTKRSI